MPVASVTSHALHGTVACQPKGFGLESVGSKVQGLGLGFRQPILIDWALEYHTLILFFLMEAL